MITLNSFLRKLPELAVDGIIFKREFGGPTGYILSDGVWKLHKIGYNEYAVDKVTAGKIYPYGQWHSDKEAGDLHILKINLSFLGTVVVLGEDVNTDGDL